MTEYKIEAFVAKQVYNLTFDEFDLILNSFKKLTEIERNLIMAEFQKIDQKNTSIANLDKDVINIYNHF